MLIAAQRYTFLAIKTNIRAKQIKKNGRQIKKAMKIQTTRIYREIEEAVAAGRTTVSLQGSARSSKTYNILIWLIVHCLRHPGTRLSIVRATLPSIKGSVYVDFKEILTRMGIYEEKAMNKTELTYRFGNGSWVEFFSTDSEQKLRGRKRDVLFVNEANELGFIEWHQLKMRTTHLSILDYNPSFSDEHWICGVNADSRTHHFISTYRDNPFLEQTVIDEIESLRDKNESLWRVYGLGLQAVVEGLVFPRIEVIDRMPSGLGHRYIGMDFGFTNDPTAIVEVGIDGDTLYADQIEYRTQMLSSDIIAVLRQTAPKMKIISESADPRLIQEIYRGGLDIHPVSKFAGSVEAGILKMQELRIKVTRRSAETIREFKNYTYRQDKEGNWLNQPIDAFNHAIDAIRYVVLEQVLGGRRPRIDLGRLGRMV